MLVEDNGALRFYLQEVLADAGYTVFVAAHAVQAILMSHAMRSERQGFIDLLITDIAMPDIDGVDLADRLRKYCPALKVLYISGVMDESSVPCQTTDPPKAFLPKPFLPPVLLQKVEHLLDARPA
ncbi:MAG: response regulator [Nitrospirae bacterium]|nr:response regulator [Nitrospirota bacterium]